jgi:hypothetical protein
VFFYGKCPTSTIFGAKISQIVKKIHAQLKSLIKIRGVDAKKLA